MGLSNVYNWSIPNNAEANAAVLIHNPDGTPYPISGLTWEFVARDGANAVVITLTTTPSAQGVLTVATSPDSQVTITLYAAATATLSPGRYAYTLWANPNQPSATAWLTGSLQVVGVAQP